MSTAMSMPSSFSGLGISGGAVSASPSRSSPSFPTSAGRSRVARVPARGSISTGYPRTSGGGRRGAPSPSGGGMLSKGKAGVGRSRAPQGQSGVALTRRQVGSPVTTAAGDAIQGAATLVVAAAPCKLRKCMGRRGCMCPKKAAARPKAHPNAGGGGLGVGGTKMIKARVGRNDFDPGPFGCDRCNAELDEVQWEPAPLGGERKVKRRVWCRGCCGGQQRWIYDEMPPVSEE